MSKQLLALLNYILFPIVYCNKGYFSTYEGFKHAPCFVCLIFILVYSVDANSRYRNKLSYMTINKLSYMTINKLSYMTINKL